MIDANPSPNMPPAVQLSQETQRHAHEIPSSGQLSTVSIIDVPEYETKYKGPWNRLGLR
jgi:hypothetical protein